jgi:hypothetical protein
MLKNIDWKYLTGEICPCPRPRPCPMDTDMDRDMDMDILSAIVASQVSLSRYVQISPTNVEISSKFTYMNNNLLTLNCVYVCLWPFLSFSFILFVILNNFYLNVLSYIHTFCHLIRIVILNVLPFYTFYHCICIVVLYVLSF